MVGDLGQQLEARERDAVRAQLALLAATSAPMTSAPRMGEGGCGGLGPGTYSLLCCFFQMTASGWMSLCMNTGPVVAYGARSQHLPLTQSSEKRQEPRWGVSASQVLRVIMASGCLPLDGLGVALPARAGLVLDLEHAQLGQG